MRSVPNTSLESICIGRLGNEKTRVQLETVKISLYDVTKAVRFSYCQCRGLLGKCEKAGREGASRSRYRNANRTSFPRCGIPDIHYVCNLKCTLACVRQSGWGRRGKPKYRVGRQSRSEAQHRAGQGKIRQDRQGGLWGKYATNDRTGSVMAERPKDEHTPLSKFRGARAANFRLFQLRGQPFRPRNVSCVRWVLQRRGLPFRATFEQYGQVSCCLVIRSLQW